MKVFDRVLSLIAPYDCLVCGNEGRLLCADCQHVLGARIPSRCYLCFAQTKGYEACTRCKKADTLNHVRPNFVYQNEAKQLVSELKFGGKRSAATEMAALIEFPAGLPPSTVVTHIPTATSRVRERGYDQAELLAKALAARHKLVHIPLLVRTSQKRQLGKARQERLRDIKDVFRVLPKNLKGAHILLVDDVVTTGATLSEAARTLRLAGARQVDAVTFAQTPK